MAAVIDVGQYIYDKLDWINAWKLQKLTYYVQSWSLAWDGDPIFDPEFQAWPDGPVSPTLHRENKYYRKHHFSTALEGANVGNLTDRQRLVIEAVLEHYGAWTKEQLVESTHSEDPWIEARGELKPDAASRNCLRIDTMKSYYSIRAITSRDVPKAPIAAAAGVRSGSYDCEDLLSEELDRWADTLAWLAVR